VRRSSIDEKCKVCWKVDEGKSVKKMRGKADIEFMWIGCSGDIKTCSYWIHNGCLKQINRKMFDEKQCKAILEDSSNPSLDFFCPKHSFFILA
jgi:hypothetical protein